MIYLIVTLAFVAGFLLVFGVNFLIADIGQERRKHLRQLQEEEFRIEQRLRARDSMRYKELYELAAQGYAEVSSHETIGQRIDKFIEQSGLRVHLSVLVLLSVLAGPLPAALIVVFVGNWFLAIVVAVIGVSIPFVYVAMKRAKKREKLLSQLPDAFELMSRVLRAGQTIPQALLGVADEFSRPIAAEFGYCYEQQNLGLSPEAALRELANRTGLLEIKIFVLAVTVHQQAGGNLSQLLDKLAVVIRERYRIRGQIKALTAEGKLQATILLALPLVVLLTLLLVRADYVMTLFDYPWLLIGMFVAEALGALWMRKIINFDF